jgi:hypothetical protein
MIVKERISCGGEAEGEFASGLPDLSWYNIPKREHIYQMT